LKQIGVVVCIAFALGGCASQVGAPAPAIQLEDAAADQVQVPAAPLDAKTPPSTALVEQEVHCDVEAKCLAKLRGIASLAGPVRT
jgi:PBP1b-binding outer membrane lipoprotein LpoB